MLSGRSCGAMFHLSPVSCSELFQVLPLSVDRTYFIGRKSVGYFLSKSPAVSRMKTKMSPLSVLNGIGYVAPRPSGMIVSVQTPSTECGLGERANHSSLLCRP